MPPAMQQALREITEMLAQAQRLAGRPPDAMAPSGWQHAGDRVQGQLQARLATLRRQEVETQGAPLSAALPRLRPPLPRCVLLATMAARP